MWRFVPNPLHDLSIFERQQKQETMFDDDHDEPTYSETHRFFATAFLVLQIGLSVFLVWYFFTHS
jgi:hypothetical protein